jgi:DNA-binding GntR family transcriptional regulator
LYKVCESIVTVKKHLAAIEKMTTEIKHRTLSSAIAEKLRQDILSGLQPSGVQLRQDALAAAYGVSRIPVREALFQLEAEGLVQLVPHKGAIVTSLSPDEINDVFDLRALLEPRLLKQSIPALMPADLKLIDSIQTRFSTAIQAKDLPAWGELNAQLHSALYARAQLPQTASMVTALLQKSDRYTRMQLSSPAAMQHAQREHAELVKLCKAKKVKAACDLLVLHIETVRTDLLRLLNFTPPM